MFSASSLTLTCFIAQLNQPKEQLAYQVASSAVIRNKFDQNDSVLLCRSINALTVAQLARHNNIGLESAHWKQWDVLFYSDLGLKNNGEETLLGFFWFDFVTEKVTHWTTIVHGGSVEYPNFEVVGKLESGWNVSQSKWWCSLNYTEPGQSSARLIK
ncbi:hypothetical protein TYRP_023788 [Tyrophagus putrescentiae]|nr:hypothetical protein TYRP_023788 [Tyrophagus putrescentiae]